MFCTGIFYTQGVLSMRKYQWIFVIVALIGCAVFFTSCQRVGKMLEPVMPEPEPTETVEPAEPVEPLEEEQTIEPEPEIVEPEMVEPLEEEQTIEPEPEMVELETPVDPAVVEPVTSGVKSVPPGIEGIVVCVVPTQITSPAVATQLQVSIQIAQAADVTGYEFTLEFDPTALRYVESSNADYLPAGAFGVPTVASETSVYMGAASLGDAASASSGTLATITFEVIAAKASTLTLSEVTLTDSKAEELSLTAVNGDISAP
jgi:hypothetical protein